MDRRSVLAAGGFAALGGALAACGGGSEPASGPAPSSSPSRPSGPPGGAPPAVASTASPRLPGDGSPGRPVIVGHRGAAGYRPEHTAASYELAARFGADAVDVDLCSTRDGALVARHEPEIGATTDVAAHPEFANRRRTGVVIDGTSTDGWFVSDFTLAELRTLRAVERIPRTRPHNTLYDRRYPLLTLDEVLDLLDRVSAELGRRVGVLPEVKHSTYHRSIGLPVEPALVETLRRRGRDRPDSGVIVQSFETGNLRALKSQLGCPLLQLIDAATTAVPDLNGRTYAELLTPDALRGVATYATWLAPTKELVTPELLANARAVGLETMPYTFRNENEFLPAPLRRGGPGAPADTYGDAFTEYQQLYAANVEGLFSDNADTAIAALGAARS